MNCQRTLSQILIKKWINIRNASYKILLNEMYKKYFQAEVTIVKGLNFRYLMEYWIQSSFRNYFLFFYMWDFCSSLFKLCCLNFNPKVGEGRGIICQPLRVFAFDFSLKIFVDI